MYQPEVNEITSKRARSYTPSLSLFKRKGGSLLLELVLEFDLNLALVFELVFVFVKYLDPVTQTGSVPIGLTLFSIYRNCSSSLQIVKAVIVADFTVVTGFRFEEVCLRCI